MAGRESGRPPVGAAARRPPAVMTPPSGRKPTRAAADTGGVTVEAALALCALTVFLVLALGTLTVVAQSLRCADAARELARLAARGEPDRGRAVAARLAPPGAGLAVTQDGETVVATVSARLVGSLPMTVNGRAVAAVESGVGS
jgi:hypothetical protein